MAELFYVLLGVIFGGYFALAGYDYGVGILLRTTAKTETERRLVLGALGPFFLGNEVWLVAGLGLLLGAFPMIEGEMLSGLYPVMIPLMAAIVVFTAAVQVRSRAAAARPVWDLLIVVGGFVISFGWGAALGGLLQGFPFRLGPLPIVMGAMVTALFTLHGATLLNLRSHELVRERSHRVIRRMGASALVLVVVAAGTAVVESHPAMSPWRLGGLFALLALAVLCVNRLNRIGRRGWALVASGLAASLPVALVGLAALPYVYVHEDPARSVVLADAAASPGSLEFLAIAAVPVLPVLLAFQAVTWWIWRRAPRQPIFY